MSEDQETHISTHAIKGHQRQHERKRERERERESERESTYTVQSCSPRKVPRQRSPNPRPSADP